MKIPSSKAEFYALYFAGAFGNRPQLWASWPELRASGYAGNVTIRDAVPGGPCVYGYPVARLHDGIWPPGFSAGNSRFNESMPDEFLLLQGNVWMACGGLRLEYSREPNIGHRQAVRAPYLREAQGLFANALLRALLRPSDFDDLTELLENYDGAIVEFSTYSRAVGVIPGRATVIWEVRGY